MAGIMSASPETSRRKAGDAGAGTVQPALALHALRTNNHLTNLFVLAENSNHTILPLQFQFLQTFAVQFLLTREKAEIIV